MKRTLIAILTVCISLVSLCIGVNAADEKVGVFVSIADEDGKLAVAAESIAVRDADNDGVITMNDALICAHEEKYEGGASAGYSSVESAYGVSLTKLWGCENGGSYGYYLNNSSPQSLLDRVSDGDHVYAYVFTDLITWSDTYCFFDKTVTQVREGETITLKLSYLAWNNETFSYDALALENATIIIDGVETEYKTDENGSVSFSIDSAAEACISARSDSILLVPPVCVVTVVSDGALSDIPEQNDVPALTDTSSDEGSEGCFSLLGSSVSVLVLGVVVISAVLLRKKNDE